MFEDVRIASKENRNRAAHHLPIGEVPRHYRQYRPQRQVGNVSIVTNRRFLILQHRRAIACVPLAKNGALLNFRPGLDNGFPHFVGSQLRQIFHISSQFRRDFEQQFRALRRIGLRPFTISCIGLSERCLKLCFCLKWVFLDHLTRSWIEGNGLAFRHLLLSMLMIRCARLADFYGTRVNGLNLFRIEPVYSVFSCE